MKAGPKAAVDPTVLPFRPQSTGAARFAKFCERFVKVPKGTGGKPLYVWVIASEITGRRFKFGPEPDHKTTIG